MMVIEASFRFRMSTLASGLALTCLFYLASGILKLIPAPNAPTVNGTLTGLGGKRSTLLTVVADGRVHACAFNRCGYPDWRLDEGRRVTGVLNEKGELIDVLVDGSSRMARSGAREIKFALFVLGLPSAAIWMALFLSKRKYGGSVWR